MNKQKVEYARLKWLIPTIILLTAMIGVAIAFWIGMFSPRKVERLYFASCQWSEDPSSGDITGVQIYIANTGADELIINKIWINGTLIDSREWESFPSMRFQAGDQGVLYITPSLIVFKEGTTYQFTIGTVAGNSFSYTATAKSGTFIKTEELKITSVTFPTSSTVKISVSNTGANALTISSVTVDDVSKTVTYGGSIGSDGSLAKGASGTITINFTWTFGYKYTFAVLTTSGNKYTYTTTATP